MVCFLENIVVRICSAVLSFPHADCQNSRTRSISSMAVSMENRLVFFCEDVGCEVWKLDEGSHDDNGHDPDS